jgi:hypothetical protein
MRSSRPARASGAVASVLGLAQLLASAALAADPSPTAAAGGDPRSSGQGPGLVGDPLWAIAIVVVIGVTTLLVTLAYVRTSRGREDVPGR